MLHYTLKSLNGPEFITCPCETWEKSLVKAREEGWDPEGTRYDYLYQLDEYFEESYDDMYNLFMYIQVTQWKNEWNGNYLDKENQVVTEEDAWYLYLCLKDTDTDPALVEFVKKGSFRICST